MSTVYFLQKAEKNAINSNEDVKYFLTSFERTPGLHPIYISKELNEQCKTLGEDYYSHTVAQWVDDIDTEIKLAEYFVEMNDKDCGVYWDNARILKELTHAKEILETENVEIFS